MKRSNHLGPLPDEERNFFGELLSILTDAELKDLGATARAIRNYRLAEILDDERIERKMIREEEAK
jgi:hypothetical protein